MVDSGFLEAMWLYKAQQEEAYRMNFIIDGIKSAMAPFKATDISIYVDSESWDGWLITVTIKNLPDVYLKHMVSLDEVRTFNGREEEYWAFLGQLFAKQFLAIPRIEPEPQFILGEE